jgi:hypothetical protein
MTFDLNQKQEAYEIHRISFNIFSISECLPD